MVARCPGGVIGATWARDRLGRRVKSEPVGFGLWANWLVLAVGVVLEFLFLWGEWGSLVDLAVYLRYALLDILLF